MYKAMRVELRCVIYLMTRLRFAGYLVFEGTVSGDSGDIAIDDISVRRGACGVRMKNQIKSHGNLSFFMYYVHQFRFFPK